MCAGRSVSLRASATGLTDGILPHPTQFLLEEAIEAGKGGETSIVCTQPRRIAAMSVAQRVADERSERLGDIVGYQVRLEAKRSDSTRLLFCTTGVLLRKLAQDRALTGTTHIIVDEIHERGMYEDFLLIVLRDLLPMRPDLRVVLMSATLNADAVATHMDSSSGGATLAEMEALFNVSIQPEDAEFVGLGGAEPQTSKQRHSPGQHKQPALFKRLLRLDNNPLIHPLPTPPADNDPVGGDIADIPTVRSVQMVRVRASFNYGSNPNPHPNHNSDPNPNPRRCYARRCGTGTTRCTRTTA